VPTKRAKPPTVRLRRLAAELRNLRSAAQLSREQVEQQTGINEGTLYRLETARARPQRRTLMTLLDLYGAEDSLRKDLLAISRSADDQGWLRPYHSALPEEYTAYISFEAEARSVQNYESLFIPGLLQTEDYARAVITGVLPGAAPDQVDQRVQARIERQQLLDRADPRSNCGPSWTRPPSAASSAAGTSCAPRSPTWPRRQPGPTSPSR
jgi:transcriptional regulator with XRE-family HTH domain